MDKCWFTTRRSQWLVPLQKTLTQLYRKELSEAQKRRVVFSTAQQKKVQSPGLAWVRQWAARCSLSSQNIANILFCAPLTKPGFLSQLTSRSAETSRIFIQ